MKQLTILAVLILGTAVAKAADYKCSNATQSINLHTLPVPKGEEVAHAVLTLTTPEFVETYNGSANAPGGLTNYSLLGTRGETASLQISVVQHHGHQCGRCAGGDSFDYSTTYAKLTTMSKVYDFICN